MLNDISKLSDKFNKNNFKSKSVLITIHRRENHEKRLQYILKAIIKLAKIFKTHQFIIPLHQNPNVKKVLIETLDKFSNIVLIPALNYPNLVYVMKYAKLIITDNGDIQEEGTSFKVPILVARYTTERMEGIKMKCAKLVGADEKNIFKEASKILKQNKKATRVSVKNPYEDGKASKKIIKYIREFFKNERFN